MRLSKDLLSKPIITISDGRMVGEVKDIYLTADLTDMAGIHLGKEGLLRRKSKIIAAEGVVVFGIDAILVQDVEVVTDDRTLKEASHWVRLDNLVGREVDTPGGTRVGTIGDVVLDEAGRVIAFMLSRVYVEGPIAEKRLIAQTAVIDNGNADGIMTIDIARAESASLQSAADVESEAEVGPAAEPEPERVPEIEAPPTPQPEEALKESETDPSVEEQ